MLVALTGATGTVGTAVLATLRERGHRVRALVRGGADRLPSPGIEVVDGRTDDVAALDALVTGCDAVLHAAYADMTETPAAGRTIAEQFVQANVVGSLRLLERAATTTRRQMVFVSSLAVYGDRFSLDPLAQRLPLDEAFPVRPREFYGAHKAAIETMLTAAAHTWGLNASSFRLGCVLARYRDPARDPLQPFVASAVERGEIDTAKGAYVVADVDAAHVLVDALGDPAVAGAIFNVFDRWLDFTSLAAPLSDLLHRPVAVKAPAAPEPQPPLRNDSIRARLPQWHTRTRLNELLAERLSDRG